MESALIKEIIFCQHDTLKDRANLLRPMIVSTFVALAITSFCSLVFGLDVLVKELIVFLAILIVTSFLIKKFYKNPILFLPSLSLLVLSLFAMIESPESNKWLILQVFSLIVINIIGSTRCNAMMFLLISLSSIILHLNGIKTSGFISSQLVLFAIFPTMLFSSYYRSVQSIEKLNNIQQLHNLELEIIKREKFAELAKISSVIAHEVNNALATLNGNLMLLKANFPNAEAEVTKAEKCCERIYQIVSLIKMKSFPVQATKQFNLSDAIKDEVMFLKLSAKKYWIEFDTTRVNEGISFFANETELIQVFTNLVSNSVSALKDMPFRNSGKLIKIVLDSDGHKITLQVEDNGIGIPETNRDKIFQEGFTTKEKGEGTGLGLYLVKKIVEKYHGSINLTSSTEGTCFTITLPVSQKS